MNSVIPQSRGDGTNKRVTIAMAATGNPVCTVFVSDCLILIASRYQDQWYRVRAAPTGIAASGINDCTIHSILGLA